MRKERKTSLIARTIALDLCVHLPEDGSVYTAERYDLNGGKYTAGNPYFSVWTYRCTRMFMGEKTLSGGAVIAVSWGGFQHTILKTASESLKPGWSKERYLLVATDLLERTRQRLREMRRVEALYLRMTRVNPTPDEFAALKRLAWESGHTDSYEQMTDEDLAFWWEWIRDHRKLRDEDLPHYTDALFYANRFPR